MSEETATIEGEEPSMEDILSSIRKILSEEEGTGQDSDKANGTSDEVTDEQPAADESGEVKVQNEINKTKYYCI